MARYLSTIVLMVLLTQITSCGHKGIYAKGYYSGRDVEKPVEVHVINKGETLYSLAWQYGYDYREVANWNEIAPPYTIYPGQKLRVKPTLAERRMAKNTVNKRVLRRAPGKAEQLSPTINTRPKRDPVHTQPKMGKKIVWTWPAKGKIITKFSRTDPGRKGIDISGKQGQAIYAAATGTVVYSGSGLRGYGKLIIVKHDDTYFSAYAHNQMIRVKEGQSVKKGEQIADMGNTGTDRIKLHFEIRRDGVPVNPFYYMPKQ